MGALNWSRHWSWNRTCISTTWSTFLCQMGTPAFVAYIRCVTPVYNDIFTPDLIIWFKWIKPASVIPDAAPATKCTDRCANIWVAVLGWLTRTAPSLQSRDKPTAEYTNQQIHQPLHCDHLLWYFSPGTSASTRRNCYKSQLFSHFSFGIRLICTL